MRTAVFLISGIPPSLNVWMRYPLHAIGGITAKWHGKAIQATEEARRQGWWDGECFEYAKATYYFGFETKRRHDPTNYAPKFIEDGLVKAGVLLDDDFRHYSYQLLAEDNPLKKPYVRIVIHEVTANDLLLSPQPIPEWV